jgi:DNA-binding transcriptional ArsR family regulator
MRGSPERDSQRDAPDALTEFLPRGKPVPGFCWQENELYSLFQPIIGGLAVLVFVNLSRLAHGAEVTFSLRSLAKATTLSRASVSRALASLKHIGMVRLRVMGGNLDSKCELADLKKLAERLGARYDRGAASLVLSDEIAAQRKADLALLRKRLQGKKPTLGMSGTSESGGTLHLSGPKRDACGLPERRERPPRETLAGPDLIVQNTKQQDFPSPTPSPRESTQQQNPSTNDKTPEALLKWARDQFTGASGDVRNHILNASAAMLPHLADGWEDWKRFGFASFRVEAASWCGPILELKISASDVDRAQQGFKQYQRTWDPQLREWFRCEVKVNIVPKL